MYKERKKIAKSLSILYERRPALALGSRIVQVDISPEGKADGQRQDQARKDRALRSFQSLMLAKPHTEGVASS